MSDTRTSQRNKFKIDRLDILEDEVAHRLNTYRNWGGFDLMIDPFPTSEKKETDPVPAKGTKSLFSNVHAVYYSDTLRRRNNMPLIDTQQEREAIRNESDCSIKALVAKSAAGRMGRAVYNYVDFMYCKELGRVSNNYLVTLRRFPVPCGDDILFINPDDPEETNAMNGWQSHSPDIGRMVTWIGVSGNDMSNILKYNYKMPFKETEAEVQDYSGQGDSGNGVLGGLLNLTDAKYRETQFTGYGGDKAFNSLSTVMGSNSKIGKFLTNNSSAPYSNAEWRSFKDRNKVYGPIDAIKKTTVRGEEGLEFSQSISLVFDYEMRAYDGINTKAAFLDLLSNILAVTYTTGTFWGGGYRMTSGSPQSNVYANLPIMNWGKSGEHTFGGAMDALTDSVKSIWGALSQGEGLVGMLKTLGSSLFSSFTGAALNKLGRPTKIALNSLLEPIPTGMWHLTIGNPMHPIMVIGNLILENTEIEHYGPLGLDDFPTGLRVTCTLKHGKPRDTSLIESMYVMGHSRIYIPVGEHVERMYQAAAEYKESEKTKYQTYTSKKTETVTGSDATTGTTEATSNGDGVDNSTRLRISNLYFGTSNQNLILNAAKEVAFGSQSSKQSVNVDTKINEGDVYQF